MKVKFENRPTCSCGVKMKLVSYVGCYESFNYWDCDNCKQSEELDQYKPDRQWYGNYA